MASGRHSMTIIRPRTGRGMTADSWWSDSGGSIGGPGFGLTDRSRGVPRQFNILTCRRFDWL